MIPLPSLAAAVQVSATGWVVLAAYALLAVFGTRISNRIAQEGQS
ncbi:hypothetical protein [Streptomyces sp. NPDC058202]